MEGEDCETKNTLQTNVYQSVPMTGLVPGHWVRDRVLGSPQTAIPPPHPTLDCIG